MHLSQMKVDLVLPSLSVSKFSRVAGVLIEPFLCCSQQTPTPPGTFPHTELVSPPYILCMLGNARNGTDFKKIYGGVSTSLQASLGESVRTHGMESLKTAEL